LKVLAHLLIVRVSKKIAFIKNTWTTKCGTNLVLLTKHGMFLLAGSRCIGNNFISWSFIMAHLQGLVLELYSTNWCSCGKHQSYRFVYQCLRVAKKSTGWFCAFFLS
jgi:hypothetical protein